MKRFGCLVLLSAILLEATSADVLQIPITTSEPETLTGSAESEIPTVSERQNVSTIVSWQMEDVINSANDVCNITKRIDRYDDTTITTLPLRRGLEYQEKFNDYVTSFNKDLEVAQSHMRVWRKGKSIVTDIRKTYNNAKEYEKRFDRMYDTGKGRMETVEEDSIHLTVSLEEDIRELKADIATLESETPEENEDLRTSKKTQIAQKKEDLVKKEEKLKASTPIALKLAEMSVFISYVRTHASEVAALATTSSVRIEQLYENIKTVNNTFSVHANNAENNRESLNSDEQRLNKTIQTTRSEIDRLEEQKVQLKAKQDNLMRESEENFERMKSLREEITKQGSAFQNIKDHMCKTANVIFIKFGGNCDDAMNHQEIKNEAIPLEDERQQCLKNQTRINEEIEQLSPQITVINTQTKTQSDKIHRKEEEIKKIKYEKMAFDMFIQDLQNMEKGITSVLKDLKDLLKMIRRTEAVFQHIDTDLGKMIDQSEAPETEGERDMALEKIIGDLDSHQSRIDQSSEKIINMRLCTRLSS